MKHSNYAWYRELKKPSFAPPGWLFGIVWTVLYFVLGFSLLALERRIFTGAVPAAVIVPFALNLVFNLAYTPIQFRLKNNYLALVDVILVAVTLLWALISVFPYYPVAAYANIPYLLWAIFATILQVSIVRLNGKRTG